MMPSIFDSLLKPEISQFGLMLDYDGTSTPITDHPDMAQISDERLHFLMELVDLPYLKLAMVSGRSVKTLQTFMAPLTQKNILLCGLHGGEIYDCQKQQYIQQPDPAYGKVLQDYKARLIASLVNRKLNEQGLIIEDKTYAITLHVRNMTVENAPAALALMEELYHQDALVSEQFRLQPGKAVLEILPKTFNKGHGVRFVTRHWQLLLGDSSSHLALCYAGDDLTDEAGFQAVNDLGGLSVRVGESVPNSSAQATVATVADLYRELSHLQKALSAVHF